MLPAGAAKGRQDGLDRTAGRAASASAVSQQRRIRGAGTAVLAEGPPFTADLRPHGGERVSGSGGEAGLMVRGPARRGSYFRASTASRTWQEQVTGAGPGVVAGAAVGLRPSTWSSTTGGQ